MLRFTVPIAVLVAIATCAAEAFAAPPPLVVQLEYEVAPDAGGCPGADAFHASVNRQLGYGAFRDGADRRVAVRISRKESGFAAWVRWSDAAGNWVGDRRLASRRPECDEIAANVACAVAVQIQLLAALTPADSGEGTPTGTGAGASSADTSDRSSKDTSSANEPAPVAKAKDKPRQRLPRKRTPRERRIGTTIGEPLDTSMVGRSRALPGARVRAASHGARTALRERPIRLGIFRARYRRRTPGDEPKGPTRAAFRSTGSRRPLFHRGSSMGSSCSPPGQ